MVLVMAACVGYGEPADETDEGKEGTEEDNNGEDNDESASASGGDLIISIGADVVSLSTHGSNDVPSSNVQENIYETLTTLDENQEVQPGLAEDWEEVDETT